jgi:anti-sigma B factor antagonist
VPGQTPLTIETVSVDAATTRITLRGDLDFGSAPELATSSAREEGRRVELDLSEVTFIDSSGLAALVRLRQRVLAAGGELRVVAVTPYLRGLMRMTALDQLFTLPPA